MKTKLYSASACIILIVAAVQLSHTPAATLPEHPSKLTYDSLKWTIPLGDPYRCELNNGCIAYIAEDPSLPLIKITAYVRYGSLLDPKGKEGLSTLLATMLRNGGTKKFPADTLDELIDLLALRLGFSAGESQFSFTGSFLSEYSDNAFTIIEELFFHPVFDEKKLEKERKILLESIKHRFDNPGPTLSTAFEKCMYPGQPSSRLMSEASIKSITHGDLVALHTSIFTPGNIIFCIAGAFNRDSMKMRLENFFRDAPAAGKKMATFPKITINRTPKCLLVHKEISQAYVRMGLPLFQRPHPDYYPMLALNLILGGSGFTSRLGQKVRNDAGLTYSIDSDAESNYTFPAPFHINFFTKNATFAQAVTLTLAEVRQIVKDGVTDEELANVKALLIGELPSMFRSADDIVATYGWNEYYHRAPDHFRIYPEKIRALTRNDLSRVARQYLNADSMTIAVVGDSTALLHIKSDDFSLVGKTCTTIVPGQIPALP